MCVYNRKIYIICRRIRFMTYTEIKERNGRKYYYRVLSVRKNNDVSKKRKYLGVNLAKKELNKKEAEADKKLNIEDRKEIKEIRGIKRKIINVLKKYKVTKAGIFGSYARGENKKKSDIDILVEIKDKKMSLLGFVGIKLELEDSLKRKVDLVEYKMIRPEIKDNILKDEVRIYEKR